MTRHKIEQIAKELGWNIEFFISRGNKWVNLSKPSPAGQDFCAEFIYISLDHFLEDLYNYWENYDPSQEAYYWLDCSGHGKNGAPYEMGDVYNDMVACESNLKELYDALLSAESIA